MRSTFAPLAAAMVAAGQVVGALDLNVQDTNSVKTAASTVAKDLWSYYNGNTDQSQLGLLPKPYYWWEAGAMFGTMISYSYLTGDNQYNDDVAKGIYSQASPTNDFMKTDTQSFDLGNDDQAFWALTAMSAAEHKLPPPSGQSDDIWLTLASGAFNDLIGRWNTSFCGGGIKWQFIQANNGYKYKSSIANAATMQLGARLALLTGNQTYADKATMIYDWMHTVGFITESFQVLDGAGDDPDNCTKIDQHEWSYNSASVLGAAAALANFTAKTGSPDAKTWADRTSGIWQHASQNFLKNGVLYEQACEDVGTCNTDQLSFKAYLARWGAFAGQIVPAVQSDVQKALQSTADAMAKSCTGNGGSACGTKWYDGSYDSTTGVGQEMSALEVLCGLLAPNVPFVSGTQGGSNSNSTSSASSSAATAAATTTTSAAAPAGSSAVPTTMATSTVAASPSSNGDKAAAPTASASPAPAPTVSPDANQQAGQPQPSGSPPSSVGSGTGSGSPQPVMIGTNGVPYCTEAV